MTAVAARGSAVAAAPALVAVPPALTAGLLGLWETGRPSLWTDELVTADVARRSAGQIWRLLGNVDAVHGAYYLLMHAFTRLAGASPEALRLPSVAAMAVAAGALAVLGRTLAGPACGLVAGMLYAVLPVVSQYALEARSYALVTAVAVLATGALVRALRTGRAGWFALYAALTALAGLLHLFAFLLVGAHLVTVLLGGRHRVAWLVAAAAATVPMTVLGAVAAGQSAQVEWIRPPDAAHLWASAQGLAGGAVPAVLLAACCVAGVVAGPRTELVAVALPWLAVPPAALLALSVVEPVFVARYLLFCVPAVALLAASGLLAMPRPALMPVAAVLLAFALVAQPGLRRPDSKWHDVTPVVAVMADRARPGDGFVATPTGMRTLAGAYPRVFAPLKDVALAVPGARQGTLQGRNVPGRELAARLRGLDRVWLIRRINGNRQARDLARRREAQARAAGLTVRAGRWSGKRMRLTLLVRPGQTGFSNGLRTGK